MNLFLDVESTGSSNEFYDKFSIRHHISVIVKELWKDLHHKVAIVEHSRSNEFVRFVNMLINDTTFLLDESLNCLKSINEIQQLMKNRPEWEALTRVSELMRNMHACYICFIQSVCMFMFRRVMYLYFTVCVGLVKFKADFAPLLKFSIPPLRTFARPLRQKTRLV